jgi:hypothetical protein
MAEHNALPLPPLPPPVDPVFRDLIEVAFDALC